MAVVKDMFFFIGSALGIFAFMMTLFEHRMRVHYRAIGILANLHIFEAPFARRIVRKRSRPPSRWSESTG